MVAVAERRPSDEQLGELTAAGDVQAFATLYQRHVRGLYDLAFRIVRDADAAADVVYESVTEVWAALQKRRVEDVRACLYVAAGRTAVARARSRQRTSPDRQTGREPNLCALDTRRLADPTAVLRDPQLVRLVWESAAALDPRDYALLDLQLRKGVGSAELASELATKRATLDARLGRLRDEFARSVSPAREPGDSARISPLAVFAALAPLALPPGVEDAVKNRALEHPRAPLPSQSQPSRLLIALAAGVVLAVGATVVALVVGGGPKDPTGFRSVTHQIGAQTSDAAIRISWAPEPGASGYSVSWSNEPALPDETVDLPGRAGATSRTLTPGQWWFNLRTRDGDGEWTHTVHVGPYVVVPVPDTKIVSRPGGVSNDPRPVFRLEATGEGAFECRLDRGDFKPCGARAEIRRVKNGRHRLEARVRDPYGNVDASPAVWAWRVDTKAPRTRIVSAESSERAARFRFASSERRSTFVCRMDEGEFRRCRSPVSASDLRQGEHVFVVRATDAAGNRDRTPAVHRWEVDTRAPRTRIVSGPSGVVHRAKATFVLDSNEDVVSYECSLDGRAFAACGATVTFTGLAAGEHNFTARATDEAGNVDRTPARRRWTIVDTSRPHTTITDHPRVSSSDTSPTFRFRSSEPGSTFECRLDAGAWRACSSPKTYGGLAAGQHVFRVRARDASGNRDPTPATWTWTIH